MARPRKYTLNENYFKQIDNQNKAYILGFIYADGSISKKGSLTICLAEKDIEILYFIKNELCYGGNIIKKVIKNHNYSLLNITSKILTNDLLTLGIIHNKTYNSKSLPKVTSELYHHMLRGYFDGDGSIYGNNKKTYIVNFSSNIFNLKEVKTFLIEKKIKSSNIRLRNKFSIYSGMLDIHGNIQIENLYNLLYNNSIFCLKRKKEKFLEFKKYLLQLSKRKITENTINIIKNLYLKGKTQKEISVILNINFSTIRNNIQRLRKKQEI